MAIPGDLYDSGDVFGVDASSIACVGALDPEPCDHVLEWLGLEGKELELLTQYSMFTYVAVVYQGSMSQCRSICLRECEGRS